MTLSSRPIFLFEHDLFGKPVPTFPDHAPVRTQYKARVRQITLLFPHDNSLEPGPLRRNVPITTTQSRYGNGQAMPGRCTDAHAGRSKSYFAAVGSGTGLSASVRR